MDCKHEWEPRPEANTNGATRYQCALCKGWGYRNWTTPHNTAIQVYKEAGKLRMKPKPEWFRELIGQKHDEPRRPVIRDVGIVESLTPSNWKWHNPK